MQCGGCGDTIASQTKNAPLLSYEREIAMKTNERFALSDCEHETLRRAAKDRSLPFNEDKREYTSEELATYGLVREGYNRKEMRERGVTPSVVTCFDPIALAAEKEMPLDTPFGNGIRKWQLPVDMMPIRVAKTVFQKNTHVTPHIHPEGEPDNPGGGLRIVTKGSVTYNGREFGPGDWFFVPNGIPYEFVTSSLDETEVMYTYAFFRAEEGNRFSHPHGLG